MTRWRIAPFALLLLTACDAQPTITSPIACQERILAVKQSSAIDLTQQARTLSNAFHELAQGYAKLDVSDSNARQRDWVKRLERATSNISKRAAAADTVKPNKTARDSRMPNPAVMELSADISGYQNQLQMMVRELREMQSGR